MGFPTTPSSSLTPVQALQSFYLSYSYSSLVALRADEISITPTCAVRASACQAARRAGAQAYATKPPRVRTDCETDNAYPLLQPPIYNGASSPDGQQTCQGRHYPSDQDEVAQNADRLWRTGCRCRRDQDKTKCDSYRSDEVERTRRDGVLGDPDEVGRREDADTADSGDTKADHECKVFHNVLFALPKDNNRHPDSFRLSPCN